MPHGACVYGAAGTRGFWSNLPTPTSSESCSQYTTHLEPHGPCAARQDDSQTHLSGPHRRHANHSLANIEDRPWRYPRIKNNAARRRPSHCWITRLENRPCCFSGFIFAEGITSSLHCPSYGTHDCRSIGMRQHSHLRGSLEFGKKLHSFCSG